MPSWSPYAFSFNNPVRYVDRGGRESFDWGRRVNQWEWNDKVTADNYQSMGYDAYSNGKDANSIYKTESGHWVSLSPFGNSWSYASDPNKASAPTDLEGYRAWRDNPNYNPRESKMNRIFRGINSAHISIMQDEGSGAGLMFGGFGRAVKAVEAAEEMTTVGRWMSNLNIQPCQQQGKW
ncbi:hypothetical protein GNY06_04035 [Elizabethkingia argentiflava]|uniref:RHS repeat-associated core domain-containing protein n=1 Tax=Elizabethkingia argenteiflava TaxID=2681556 RepID=A0A845PVT7_9FLAO|nr:hypothetical protein [Elizabethkingia argenteiflava]NAW50587.1 hypothetical protein [Elizabethkingia argenteiflava]